MNEFIEKLRADGYKVFVHHGRLNEAQHLVLTKDMRRKPGEPPLGGYTDLPTARQINEEGAHVAPRGGITVVRVLKEGDDPANTETVAVGVAFCNPIYDNFTKSVGSLKAAARAWAALHN